MKMEKLMLIFILLASIMVAFLFIPVLNIFAYVGIKGIINAIEDRNAMESILISFEAGFLAVIMSMIFGIPLAYIVARKNFFGKKIIEAIIDLPVVVPHTVAGIALLLVLGRNGLIGMPLSHAGIRLTDSLLGISAAMLFVSAPFFINYAKQGFEAVNPKMENVAMSLGASRWQVIKTITLPISMRSIFTGAIMAWARSISEFGAVIIIAYFPMVAPVYIYSKYVERGVAAAAAPAALLLLLSITIFFVMRSIAGKWGVYDKD